MTAAARRGLLAHTRLAVGLAAVITTVLLVPVVAFGDVDDSALERTFAITGLLLTTGMTLRTGFRGQCGAGSHLLAAVGLFVGATGLERPELVAMALISNICFQTLYASTTVTIALTASYAALYTFVSILVVVLEDASPAPVEAAIVLMSLFLTAGVVRFLVTLMTELERSEARFRSLVQNSSDAVTVIDELGDVLYDSSAITYVLGYCPNERLGQSAFASVHPEHLQQATAAVAAARDEPGVPQRIEVRYRHADGSWKWLEIAITSMLHDAAVGGIVANYHDISEQKSLEASLRHQALHDPLTGMPNRVLFKDRLEHALSRRRRGAGSVVVLYWDLDDFKQVNDGMSHTAGDAVLAAVAGRLAGAVGEAGTAARLGGDEFAVLLDDVEDEDQAYALADDLRVALRQPLEIDGVTLSVGASVGVAMAAAGERAEDVLRKADLAMHEAKRRGKGMVEVYEPGLQQQVARRLFLRMELERAIAGDELEAHYQPIVELATGRIVGAEALVRWRHPVRGLLPPAEFMEIAEETGLIVPIGGEVLRQACRDLASWQQSPGVSDDFYVSVNVSPRQLQEPRLSEDITALLSSCGLRPQQLMLEVTETTLVEDAGSAALALIKLRDLGITLALDDFGTGYSSLTHLRSLPVGVIKIDRSFVASVAEEGPDRAVVQTTLLLASALGLAVVAEGVETPGDAQALMAIGCAVGQGYLFARPLPADQLVELLGVPVPLPNREALTAAGI